MSKSFIAKIEEKILMMSKPYFMDSQEKINDLLKERLNADEKYPKSIFKSIDFNGTQVFTFGDKNAERVIVFITHPICSFLEKEKWDENLDEMTENIKLALQ